jgi:hypothetical protein
MAQVLRFAEPLNCQLDILQPEFATGKSELEECSRECGSIHGSPPVAPLSAMSDQHLVTMSGQLAVLFGLERQCQVGTGRQATNSKHLKPVAEPQNRCALPAPPGRGQALDVTPDGKHPWRSFPCTIGGME